MDIQIEKTDAGLSLLKVKVEKADYQQVVDKKLEEYRRKANIKGYRAGKAPLGLVKKMVGQEIKAEQIIQSMSTSVDEFLKGYTEKIVVGSPIPRSDTFANKNWKYDDDFEFFYEVGLVDHFEITEEQLKDIQIEQLSVHIPDSLVEREILSNRIHLGKPSDVQKETIEAPEADTSSTLIVEFSLDIESEAEQAEIPAQIEGQFALTDLNNDAQDALWGKKSEDTLTIVLDAFFKEEKLSQLFDGKAIAFMEAQRAANKPLSGTLLIEKFSSVELHDFDQDFIDKATGQDKELQELQEAASEDKPFARPESHVVGQEAYRAYLRERLSADIARSLDQLLLNQIEKLILTHFPIQLPKDFLIRWLVFENQKEGMAADEIEKLKAGIKEEYDNIADSMRMSLISNHIISKNVLNIEPDNLMEAARTVVRQKYAQFFGGGDIPFDMLTQLATMEMQQEKQQSQIFNIARDHKAKQWIKERITRTERKIDFSELPKAIAAIQEQLMDTSATTAVEELS